MAFNRLAQGLGHRFGQLLRTACRIAVAVRHDIERQIQ